MPTLTILRGISGSGKSSWARNQNAVVISRDAIRHGLLEISPEDWYSGAKSAAIDENVVSQIQDAAIAACLKAGKDVIVDNTNIQFKFVRQLAKIGYRHGADVEVKVFDVPWVVAVARDEKRGAMGGRSVGREVIEKQYDRFKSNKSMTLDPVVPPRPYTGTPGKPKAFLVDIDGTLAHISCPVHQHSV